MEIQKQPENAVEAAAELPEEEAEEAEGAEEAAEGQAPAEAAATQAAAAAPAVEAKAKEGDLNIIIQFHGQRFMLGVARADCDPIFESMDGDLAAALQQVPAFVERAKQKWAVSPRYPKAPEPPAAATTTAAAPARTPAPAKPKAQPSFF